MPLPILNLLADHAEENWPSMDLCAEMLQQGLLAQEPRVFDVRRLVPPFRHRFNRLPWLGRKKQAQDLDRLINRMRDYPRYLRSYVRQAGPDAFFHLCDHSYSQVVHELPAERTGVYLHDLDTFRCLLEPEKEPRPRWFRAMARRILRGLQKAAIVFHSTQEIRRQVEHHGILDPARLALARYGIAAEFSPHPQPGVADEVVPEIADSAFVLHVGSCIPRKRIDVLLHVTALLRERWPALRLVKVGGEWTADQRALIGELDLARSISHFQDLSRSRLASLYRRARVVLIPSQTEGFGLPVIEALACGVPVVASDLPTLREAGGEAAVYAPVGDVAVWADQVGDLLQKPDSARSREQRLAHAAGFTWAAHARAIADAYGRLGG